MTRLHLDFESRSAADLKAVGVDNYSKHPTTDVWCMGYAFGDDKVEIWAPGTGRDLPTHVRVHIERSGIVVAHNASFELAIWNNVCVPRYGWPPLKPEQCRDTMAMAYAMALPGSLEKAAAAVGIKEQKDVAGGRLMMQMCRPKAFSPAGETACPECDGEGHHMVMSEFPVPCKTCKGARRVKVAEKITWWDEPEKRQKLYDYCKQDVRVERELDKRLMPLSDDEQKMWVLDQKINNRGVYVDRPTVQAAIAVVQSEQDRLNQELRNVTNNFVGFCTETVRLGKWVASRGVNMPGVAKADVLDALADESLPDDVRAALHLRQEAGKSSTAKLRAMVDAASEDGRLRGMFQYHGAGTGRWAGRRVQMQNLPRWPDWFHLDDAEQAIAMLHRPNAADFIRVFYDNPMTIISYLLRPMLTAAPGNELFVCDFANIEGRGLAWLAGEDWKLDAFRAYDAGTGPDLYKVSANRIYATPVEDVSKDQRQIGKVAELACGYGGGVGAFQTMAKTYFVKVPDEQAETIKGKWRDGHPATVKYWYALEEAAMDAVLNPGRKTSAGPKGRQVHYKVNGSFLWCLLPSGRALCYPYPKILPVKTPWGDMKDSVTYMTVIDQNARMRGKIIEDPNAKGDWQRVSTYSGKLSENVTQAICRDLLAASMQRVEDAGYPVVCHVHDEIVAEVPNGKRNLEEFKNLCAGVPAWAEGLPVTVDGWAGTRYRK